MTFFAYEGFRVVTNVTYQLAKQGELPSAFAEPIAHSREGLVISSLIIIVLAVFFDLSSIAVIGALSMLIIHMSVHIGGASPILLLWIGAFFTLALLTEVILKRITGRRVQASSLLKTLFCDNSTRIQGSEVANCA